MKRKKIALLTIENFNKEIQNILLESEVDFLIFLYFSLNMEKNKLLLEKAKKYFFNPLEDEYIKNVVILSQKGYIANDMGVYGVVTPKDIENFDYFKFSLEYEHKEYSSIYEFLEKNSKIFNYSVDFYDKSSSWIYYQNKAGVLIINENTREEILKNYHKIKFITPEIILVTLGGKSDERLVALLKLIGADAHVTLGFIGHMAVPYTKRTDTFIHIEDENFETLGKEFVDSLLTQKSYPDNIFMLRDFLNIPEKNFEADMTYDEEREVNKKAIKYYSLKREKGSSLKSEIVVEGDVLTFNTGLQTKYILSKIN